jgi:hypothetical protein
LERSVFLTSPIPKETWTSSRIFDIDSFLNQDVEDTSFRFESLEPDPPAISEIIDKEKNVSVHTAEVYDACVAIPLMMTYLSLSYLSAVNFAQQTISTSCPRPSNRSVTQVEPVRASPNVQKLRNLTKRLSQSNSAIFL